MAVNVYRWDDVGAPLLEYAAGSIIALLDACLVTGYGSKAAAGWSKPFADVATNKAVFKQGVGVGAQHFLDVDHNSATSAKVRGYQTMTAVATGAGDFPNTTQQANYYFDNGAQTAVPAQWIIVADARTFYFFSQNAQYVDRCWSNHGFGDLFSYKAADAHGCFISGGNGDSSLLCMDNNTNYIAYPEFLAADVSGNVMSERVRKTFLKLGDNQIYAGASTGGLTYPNPANAEAVLSPFFVNENVGGTVLRGTLRGLWAPCHPQPYGHLDTFNGTGALLGKTFLAINVRGSGSNNKGQMCVEISDTWDTNA